ncbi:uncharacterized protein LOC127776014 [Oryza glaberrima]|uniref:uncharacterized protein LOC127776014 n=1 Tax=Oryza glaberrima TaxID=4538 RepID=UPI00224BEEA4|nr:uncharacterized protein LOC127776014 [Oryza glaberrima]XP_052158297.1 uncharacterized protein LOC127776014 [Oryza glaberrima]
MVTVAGYMYTVRFGGLIRSETFVPPSSPSSQKLLSNPNPSPLPTRSRRRRHRHRHRLPLELVKPEPPPSSQARGASRRRRRAEPVVTVAVFPSTSCESGVPLSPPFPSPSPSHADFGSCKICARIQPPQARGNQKVKLDVGVAVAKSPPADTNPQIDCSLLFNSPLSHCSLSYQTRQPLLDFSVCSAWSFRSEHMRPADIFGSTNERITDWPISQSKINK